jgi:membrane-bound lytic murein transglycosylase MltF
MWLRERTNLIWRQARWFARVAALVAVTFALSGCQRQEPVEENTSAPNHTAASPSVSATNLVPMTDLESAELLKLNQPWKGDLDQLGERRYIRALVAFNRTNYFIDHAEQRGMAYDALVEFEKELRARAGRDVIAPKIVIIPTSRDRLLPALAAGYGDLAIGNLTITPERRKSVDFSDSFLDDVKELIVTGPSAPSIAGLDDLSGKEVHVRPSSSYHESLEALNERFRREGKEPVVIRPADELLEDEDLIQMVDAGVIGVTVVDDHIAKFWSQLYDRVKVRDDLVVLSGSQKAWALRQNTPELKSVVNEFLKPRRAGTMFGNLMRRRYLTSVERLRNPTAEAEIGRFRELADFFRKYGDQYDLPWLLLAAQGFQESRLDQSRRSAAGAVGVMQVKPATAADVGVPDISSAENNIRAGVKYMRFMIDQYFKDAPMDRLNRGLFALASYNAGPARVAGLRRKAEQMGLDPNKWFNHVEIVASREIGRETVDYVGNIYKYYTAYKSISGLREKRRGAAAQR